MKDPVTQRHDFGCGAACVAFVLNESYDSVVAKLGINYAHSKGYYCRNLAQILSLKDESYIYKYRKKLTDDDKAMNEVIVFIRRSTRYPAGHYLVWSDGLWMDPWINFVKNKNIRFARSGYRKRLPGKVQYIIYASDKKK